ncbi:hypothetical protein [Nitratireductor sp. GCM10026969]|uniref:hypothetical protein n=1 Tax=Nitratireductor sp. GCM10026969 TaxID=3252645 RepID=UPI003614D1AB
MADDLRYRIGGDTRGIDAAWSKIQRDARSTAAGINTAMGRARSGIQSLIVPLRTVQGALGALGVGVGLTQIRQMVAEIGEIGDVADKVGLTTEALQELRFAADQTGVAVGTFDTAMQRFSRRIAEVAAGANTDLARVLQANNVQLRDQEGNLRRQEDVLADYANLIKNARNEQDRLRLAFLAFDSEGAALVNTLKDGAEGLDQNRERARELGLVLERDVIDLADDLDKKWSAAWQQFETRGKSAFVALIEGAREFKSELQSSVDALGDLLSDPSLRNLYRTLFGDASANAMFGNVADARIKDAFSGAVEEANEKLVEALRERYSAATDEAASGGTIIPDKDSGSGGRGRAISELDKQRQAIDRVIQALEHELSLIGQSETQKRIMNELRNAGADAASNEGQRIAELVREIEAQRQAEERLKEAQEERLESLDHLFQMGGDALLSIADKSVKAEDALKRLVVQLALAAAQAALLGTGPLSGLIPSLIGGGSSDVTGYDTGGWTGSGDRRRVSGVVHQEEFVVRAGPAERYRPMLEAMNAGRTIGLFSAGEKMAEAGQAAGMNGTVELRVVGQPGPLFIPTIDARSEDVAVRVSGQAVNEFNRALPDRVQEINRRPRMR